MEAEQGMEEQGLEKHRPGCTWAWCLSFQGSYRYEYIILYRSSIITTIEIVVMIITYIIITITITSTTITSIIMTILNTRTTL
jgi:hypothetical protein